LLLGLSESLPSSNGSLKTIRVWTRFRIALNVEHSATKRSTNDNDFISQEREHPMEHKALRKLYIDELKDIYDAENQLVKALPKMAKAATSEKLRAGFESHLEQTRGHIARLQDIFEALGEKPTGKKCKGMMGLVKEGQEIDEDFEGEVMDAALISAAQRVEHYEIAAYGCVATWAELLGESEANALLEQTLQEEKETDHKLTVLSEEINVQAKGEGDNEDVGEEEEGAMPHRKARGAHA
jgi:ferritin-like metal-binding protein YciE